MATTNHSPGSVMLFYNTNIPTAAGLVTDVSTGFPQPMRPEHRFTNTVWQLNPAVLTDGTAMGTWPAQGQFIQQLPPTQMDNVRFHEQYSPATTVTVAAYTGYQLQSQQQQQPTSTQNNFMNGAYNAQENNLVPQLASTPNSRCSSVHAVDNNNGGDAINSSSSIPPSVSKTPTSSNHYISPVQTIGAQNQGTNQGNAMPGYPPQQPPQSPLQSLHNSSGYPGQNAQSVNHRFMGEEIQGQRQSPPKACQTPKSWNEQTDASFCAEDRENVNTSNKLKTMIMGKNQANTNPNQTQFQQPAATAANYHPPSSECGGQLMMQQQSQNGKFCTPTPSPVSPSSNMQLSSQHHQFSQNHVDHQQQQAQHELQLQHQMLQQQQIRQDEHLQHLNHQYLQQQFYQQQHIQMQQNMQTHLPNTDRRSGGHSTTTDKNLTSPTRNYPQSQPQSYYLEKYDSKQNETNNFLAVRHHLQNSVTEGGGFWDYSTAVTKMKTTNDTQEDKRIRKSSAIMGERENFMNFNNRTNDENNITYENGIRESDPNTNFVTVRNESTSVLKNGSATEKTNMENKSKSNSNSNTGRREKKVSVKVEKLECDCFPPDKIPVEPGPYYTHLGSAANLSDLRDDFQRRTGLREGAIRIEKILYTGKEGKTIQGCPMAKWIIRRASTDEKILIVVKHREGHRCFAAWIVVVIVVWEGVSQTDANSLYDLLTDKLNRFGVPTARRCATNEPRTCACQGLDQETSGASFSFGCSWSMYYNGCKYARSKSAARKFRLSVRSEEVDLEQRLNCLATHLTPVYQKVAPRAFQNMIAFEEEASACRLGSGPGRPFSGVTACVDFCAHSHRDMNNMSNGLTCVVTLTKHRGLSKSEDEQLHVLPLYTIDKTDEFGSEKNQDDKIKSGSIEVLKKYDCVMKVRAAPLLSCRRRTTKRKDDVHDSIKKGKRVKKSSVNSFTLDGVDSQLQSSQISSTVLDSPHHPWPSNSMCDSFQSTPVMSPFTNIGASLRSTSTSVSSLTYSPSNFTDAVWPLSSSSSSSSLSVETSPWNYNNVVLPTPESFRSPSSNQYGSPSSYASSPHVQSPSIDSRLTAPSFRKFLPSQDGDHIRQQRAVRNLNVEFEKYSNGEEPSVLGMVSPVPIQSAPVGGHCYPVESINRIWPGYSDIVNSSLTSSVKPPIVPPYSIPVPTVLTQQPYLSPLPSYPLSTPPFYPCDNKLPTFNKHQVFNLNPPASPVISIEAPPSKSKMKDNATKNDVNSPSVMEDTALGSVVGCSNNEDCFKDSQMGGVAISLGHGAVLFECAKNELHSTTALRNPDRRNPNRISLVFYQHRNLNVLNHGQEEWAEKAKQRKYDEESIKSSSTDVNNLKLSSPAGDNEISTKSGIAVGAIPSLLPHMNDTLLENTLIGVS